MIVWRAPGWAMKMCNRILYIHDETPNRWVKVFFIGKLYHAIGKRFLFFLRAYGILGLDIPFHWK